MRTTMMIKQLFALILSPLLVFATDNASLLKKLSKDIDWAYQDILINGETIHQGWMCPERYEVIKPILDLYDRPIKILDIGANNGYFSIRAATDYDATCVMADVTLRLKRICEYNTEVPHLIYLKKRLSTEDLRLLKEKEHFDVILVFNVLHHICPPDNWKSFLNELFELGDNVIIETPPASDSTLTKSAIVPLINDHLQHLPSAKNIGTFPRFKFDDSFPAVDPDRLDLMLWLSLKPKDEFPELYKEPIETGINLSLFHELHGRYPTKQQVKKAKASLPFFKRFFSEKIIVEGTTLK